MFTFVFNLYICSIMKTVASRIKFIIERHNISSGVFADKISISRSRLSHILTGRNNPSLEIITEILRSYPDISPDWLILGQGDMKRQVSDSTLPSEREFPKDLFSFPREKQQEAFSDKPGIAPEKVSEQKLHDETPAPYRLSNNVREEAAIRSVTVLFSNNRYEILLPEKKGD
jgi:transcriptional regulator with XRE-family HTH domain